MLNNTLIQRKINVDKNFYNIALLMAAGYTITKIGGYVKSDEDMSNFYIAMSNKSKKCFLDKNRKEIKLTIGPSESNYDNETTKNILNTIKLLKETFYETYANKITSNSYFDYMANMMYFNNVVAHSQPPKLREFSKQHTYMFNLFNNLIAKYYPCVSDSTQLNTDKYFKDAADAIYSAGATMQYDEHLGNNFYYVNSTEGLKELSAKMLKYREQLLTKRINNEYLLDEQVANTLNILNPLYTKIENYLCNDILQKSKHEKPEKTQ